MSFPESSVLSHTVTDPPTVGKEKPSLASPRAPAEAVVAGATDHAIFMIDTHGIVLSWNPGVERILGYTEDDWVGQHIAIIFTPEDRERDEPAHEQENAAENGRADDIRWHVRHDGTRIWADGVMTPIYDDTGTLIGFGKVMRDATERKRAQTALREAEERLRIAAEATGVGTFDFDPVSGELRWDERCKALFGLPHDACVDYDVFLSGLHPEDRAVTDAIVRRTLDPASGAGGEFDIEYRTVGLSDGVERWVMAKGRAFFDPERTRAERFIGTVIDITERKAAESAMREQGEYLRRLIESSPDCLVTFDLQGRILSMNEGGEQIMEVDDFASIRGLDWLTFWQDEETRRAVRTALDAARTGSTGRFQGFCPTMKGTGKWWDVVVVPLLGADGTPEQLLGVARDITERVKAEQVQTDREQRERARLTDLFMQAPAFMATLHGPRHVFDMANPPFNQLVGNRETLGKTIAEALPEVVEQGFLHLLDTVYRTGEPFIGKDMPILLRRMPDSDKEERFLDFTFQPLRDESGQITGILAHGIDLTERKRLEIEREHLLFEARARAERESLINQIGETVRGALKPVEVLRLAVEALGKALDADRCYYVTYDHQRDQGRIDPDWYRAGVGLSSIAGEYRMSDFAVNRDTGYKSGQTQVVDDVHEHSRQVADTSPVSLMDTLGLRSLVRSPLLSGGVMTALVVAMSSGPRRWTEDEVRLVEAVAAQTRAAVESARIQQRERNIAQQLQSALQPPPPTDPPGLMLDGFYRPALQEAGVGGDFYDVFPIEKGCTALVVGDLSGKGLEAASQVATVRNMTRYALYTGSTIAEAVTTLNHVLADQGLLTGFTTLFVGLYDQNARTLTYANCGQEPGLVWRAATGGVEYLLPTGPIMGGFGASEFRERVISLAPGDVFAIFTDGLTEVGPSRRDLLEVGGVAEILQRCCTTVFDATTTGTEPITGRVISGLVAGVDAYASGGVRDDMALLVGMVRNALGVL